MNAARRREVARYLRALRNPAKRGYANAYVIHLFMGGTTPDRDTYKLSYMGAQAVRLRIDEIL